MKLMVSQNFPFNPIYDAWKAGSRSMLPLDDDIARRQAEAIDAKVLSNRKPPYPPAGGLYDALTDSGGDILLATNEQARAAAKLFADTEGIDIHPAAAVATATLVEKAQHPDFPKNALIMLNITGGGEQKFKEGKNLFFLNPLLTFDVNPTPDVVKEKIGRLFEGNHLKTK